MSNSTWDLLVELYHAAKEYHEAEKAPTKRDMGIFKKAARNKLDTAIAKVAILGDPTPLSQMIKEGKFDDFIYDR